jgi:hypothetical protein
LKKLDIDVNSLETLQYKMSVVAEIRSRKALIASELNPMVDLYTMVGVINLDDLLFWRRLLDYADEATANLSSVEGNY